MQYDDLVHQVPNDPRKLLSIGTVHWQSVTGQKIERMFFYIFVIIKKALFLVSIVLFDDIVVLLHEKNGSYQFFSQKDHVRILVKHLFLY